MGSPDRDAKLLQTGLALAAELSPDAVLQRIVELAVEITEATYGALGILGSDGRITDFITTGIPEEQRHLIGAYPVGRGILGVLIDDARPLRLKEISRDPRSVGFPPNHPAMRSFLGVPVKAGGHVYGNLYLTEKQGTDAFDQEDEDALLILAAQAGVAVHNAHLFEEAGRRGRRLEAVHEISTAILDQTDRDQLLRLIADRARELVGADLATIAVPHDEGSLRVLVAEGAGAELLRDTVFPREGSVSGAVLRTGRPLILDNAVEDDRTYQPMVRAGGLGPAMFVPMLIRGDPFGTLAVANHVGGRRFQQADLEQVDMLAAQAALAVEYGRIQDELRRLAVLDDRERIAKELHDGVIQSLFAVGMGLQATAIKSGDADLEHRIEGAVNEVDRIIGDLRNYIFGLRPGVLADRRLDEAIRHLAEDFAQKTGVTTVTEIDGEVASDLAPRAGDVVQLIREALSNVGRHAGAATCRVSLYRRGPSAVAEVDDDGRGFDVEAAEGTGSGLRNLRDRAAALGGALEIESTSDQGTTVRAVVPV